MVFDLGNLNGLKNSTRKYFENGLKSMQIFQRLMGGMNRRGRSHLNQICSEVLSVTIIMKCDDIFFGWHIQGQLHIGVISYQNNIVSRRPLPK